MNVKKNKRFNWLNRHILPGIVAVGAFGLVASVASGDQQNGGGLGSPTFTTLTKTALTINSITGDNERNVYTGTRHVAGELGQECTILRVNLDNPVQVPVGKVVPSPTTFCSIGDMAFDRAGTMYFNEQNRIMKLTPDAALVPTATVYASNLPNANGLAMDGAGNLWVTDGTKSLGIVWKITGPNADCGAVKVNCEEAFRIQPMRNSTLLGGKVDPSNPLIIPSLPDGVGTQVRNFLPAGLTNSIPGNEIVANGIGFSKKGILYISDTSRGIIWKVKFNPDGSLKSPVGCDATFAPNTLCMSNLLVQHPIVQGTDGLVLDVEGNVWTVSPTRNAIVKVTPDGDVQEIFQNPAQLDTFLRNNGPMEFPTSPFILGKKLCIGHQDANTRDNAPNTAGELNNPTTPILFKGKISCMDQDLPVKGLKLPVKFYPGMKNPAACDIDD